MNKHTTVLGALFLVLGVMGLIGMFVVFLIFSIGSAAIGTAAANDPEVPAILALLPAGLGMFLCAVIAVSTLPNLIAGWGLLMHRDWGRTAGLIAGVINLPSPPFGTAVGAYAICVYVQTTPEPGQIEART